MTSDPQKPRIRWEQAVALLGVVHAVLLLLAGGGLAGGGHGDYSPLLLSVLGFGIVLSSAAAVSRRDSPSLRNWLILAAFFDILSVWMIRWEPLWDRAPTVLLQWSALWFGWQVPASGLWLLLRRRDRPEG